MRGFKHHAKASITRFTQRWLFSQFSLYLLFSLRSHNQEEENSLLVSAAIPLLVLVWDSRGQAQSWVTLLYPFCFY
jgi:hypothetical protein